MKWTRRAEHVSAHNRLAADYVAMQRDSVRPNPRPSHVLLMPIGARKKVVTDGGHVRK